MNKRFALTLIVTLLAFALISLAGTAFAQEDHTHARFTTLPQHSYYPVENGPDVTPLPQWTFTWTSSYDNRQFSSVIVGTDPSKNNTTTTLTIGIIPIKMVFGASNGNMTFDPNTPYSGSMTTTQMIASSPMFNSLIDYNQGGTDLGKTQYIDAYQRGNFWGYGVDTNTNYHVLFAKPVIGPEQTFTVPSNEGNVYVNPFGIAGGATVGVANINWFDQQLQGVIAKIKKINPGVLPLFITYNVYLSGNSNVSGCCIGGYHSANGPAPNGQTYSYSTSITQNATQPVFSTDIGALSHEIGEWLMDPFIDNPSPCPSNSILEIGDPLETGPNYGDYTYTVNGFTWHPQDLVFITWFGAPATTSLDVWNGTTTDVVSLQNEKLSVCETAPPL
jgi:hypothetical protein